MSEDESLRIARTVLRPRVPETTQDAAALRAEVRAADAALGVLLRQRAARATQEGAVR